MTDDAREIVRSLVDARLQAAESLHGAAGILAARGQSIAQRAARQQQQAFQTKKTRFPGGLQSLQKQAKHKGPTPSNKPSWHVAKYLGKKALSYDNPIGVGVTAGLDALAPGLGFVARAVQQTFGK